MTRARVFAVAVTLAAARAHGGGFELAEQSPEAAGTAGAQSADAYAPAAAYYNPAALAFQRGLTLQGGAVVTLARVTATPSVGGGDVSSAGTFATPSVFVGQRVAARFAVGVGVFDPFAASSAYPASWAGRFAGVGLELRALAVNPSLAIRPLPWLAVGFGVDVVPATLTFRRAAMMTGGGESELRLDVRGTGVGGNAAVLVRAVPRWLDVAVTYRSAVDLELSSNAARATLPLPHAFAFALATRPIAGLTVTTDVRLTLWQDLSTLSFAFPDPMAPKEVVTLNWQNSVGVRAGATYQFLRDASGEPRLTVRVGGGWEQAPTSPAAVPPPFADGDRILVSGGAGARWGIVTLDAGYMAAIVQPFIGASGSFVARYQSLTHTVAVALTLRLPELGYRVDEIAFKR